MPFLGIADHAFPGTAGGTAERELVVMGLQRLEAEDFDACAGGFMELQTGLYHTRIIIYKECPGSNMVADVVEQVFAHLPVAIDQQLAVVTLREGILGNPLIGKRIIIIRYEYRLRHL